jgi:hypothetical protein
MVIMLSRINSGSLPAIGGTAAAGGPEAPRGELNKQAFKPGTGAACRVPRSASGAGKGVTRSWSDSPKLIGTGANRVARSARQHERDGAAGERCRPDDAARPAPRMRHITPGDSC